MRDKFALLISVAIPLASARAHEISLQTGSLKGGFAPSVDFAATTYRHQGYRAGLFTSPAAQGVLVSYSSSSDTLILDLGQRERSMDEGFVFSNGAYLPWTKNFAFAEPLGARAGVKNKYAAIDATYYQREQQGLGAGQVYLTPFTWIRISGGAAIIPEAPEAPVTPLGSLRLGAMEGRGFLGGVQYAGNRNALVHARYTGDFTLRALAFRRSDEGPLASGVYAFEKGFVGQGIFSRWFAQFLSTDTRYGMVRYGGEFLTAVGVYEDKMQLGGLSLRNSATGFHLRSGVTLGVDGSLQTLAGFGYSDFLFIGGGHYALQSDEPLEPAIFPSDWYASVLLQSSTMRIKNRGMKMLALVNTDIVQGFFAVTWSDDGQRHEQVGFYMRLSGGVVF